MQGRFDADGTLLLRVKQSDKGFGELARALLERGMAGPLREGWDESKHPRGEHGKWARKYTDIAAQFKNEMRDIINGKSGLSGADRADAIANLREKIEIAEAAARSSGKSISREDLLAANYKPENIDAVLGGSTDELPTFVNDDDGMESSVHRHDKGYSVTLKDADSGERIPIIKIFPHDQLDKAIAYAKRIANLQESTDASSSSDRIPGGLADKKPDSDFDPEQLAAGIKVEMEHTDDPDIAKEIAKDHLTEDPDYYRKLRKMELKESTDAHGHEHKDKGPGGGQFTSKGGGSGSSGAPQKDVKPKHGSRAASLHAEHQALKQKRLDAFKELKKEALDAEKAVNQSAKAANKILNKTFPFDGPDGSYDTGYGGIEAVLMNWEEDTEGTSAQDRYDGLGSALQDATACLEIENYTDGENTLSAEESKEVKEHLKLIIQHVRQARKHLKTYVQHRKEMQAIRAGEPMDVQESLMAMPDGAVDYVALLEAWDEGKHPRGQPDNAGQFGSGGGGGGGGSSKTGGARRAARKEKHQKASQEFAGRTKERAQRRDKIEDVAMNAEALSNGSADDLAAKLKEAGIPEKNIARIMTKKKRGDAEYARNTAKAKKIGDKLADHKAKWQQWIKDNPKPEAPEYPADDSAISDSEQAKLDKQQDRLDAWEEKDGEFEEKADDMKLDYDVALETAQEMIGLAETEDAIQDAASDAIDAIDAEEEQDEEPEEPDWSEAEPEVTSALDRTESLVAHLSSHAEEDEEVELTRDLESAHDDIGSADPDEHPEKIAAYLKAAERTAAYFDKAKKPEHAKSVRASAAAMKEALDAIDVAESLRESWDESKHPRGQPGNPGQFGHGGGGAKKKDSADGGKKGESSSGESALKAAAEDYKKNGTKAKAFKEWFGDWENDPESASKVVNADGEPQETHNIDEEGKPVVLYHGTTREFDSFKPGTKNQWSNALGFDTFFFSDNKAVASTYKNQGDGGRIIEAYLSIKKPLVIDANGGDWTDALSEAIDSIQTYRTPEEKAFLDLKAQYIEQYGYEEEYAPENVPEDAREKMAAASRKMDEHILANKNLYSNAPRRPHAHDGIIVKNVIDVTEAEPDADDGTFSYYSTVYVAFEPTQIKAVNNRGTFDPTSAKLHESWDESKHPRDHGKWAHAAGDSGATAEHPPASAKETTNTSKDTLPGTLAEIHNAAEKIAAQEAEKSATLLGKFKEASKWLKDKNARLYGKLQERYGTKGALAIWGAGQVITWGITVGAPLVTGLPIIVPPGGGMLTSLALAGMVEAYKKFRGSKGKDVAESAETLFDDDLSAEEIHKAAVEMVNELLAELAEVPEVKATMNQE